MELSRAKGTRDFLPEEKILRNEVVDTIRTVFELYGFSPLETPTLERFEVLTAKYAGGEEIVKEIFKLSDQGKRKLALRYDFTVPLSRVVAMNPQLKLPFKRYQIGKIFRDGPLKAGRYREFTQCDADLIGVPSTKGDAEIINMALEVFKRLKIPAIIKVNNRKILDAILQEADINEAKKTTVILSMDKLEKVGLNAVKKELSEKGINSNSINKIVSLINIKGSNKSKVEALKKKLNNKEGITEMEELIKYAPGLEFDISLARGLAYYTGMVMEAFATKSKIKSSICGGGRFDNIIGMFRGSGSYPATGCSFGLDTIIDVLQEAKRPVRKSLTQIFIIPIKTFKEATEVAQELRANNINTELDLAEKGISKNLDYANKKGIPFVIFLGPEELKKKRVKLRNMQSGKEELTTIKEVMKKVKR